MTRTTMTGSSSKVGIAMILFCGCAPGGEPPTAPLPQAQPPAPRASESAAPPTGTVYANGETPIRDIKAIPVPSTATTSRTSVSSSVEKVTSALATSGEVSILALSNRSYAETAAAVYTGSDGTSQTIVKSNVLVTGSMGGEDLRDDYGCFRGSSASLQCMYTVNVSTAGSDPGMVVGADGLLYEERINANGGVMISRSSNPCPSTCSVLPTWNTCFWGSNVSMDYPMPIFADSSAQVWDVHNDSTDHQHPLQFMNDQITIGRATWCSTFSWWQRGVQCDPTSQKQRVNPHAVRDQNGLIHVVWMNVTDGEVETDTFNTTTGHWGCVTTPIARFDSTTTTCVGNAQWTVMRNFGNNNLEFDKSPRITFEPVSRTLVVNFDSYDFFQMGVDKVRTRSYSSVDGVNWFFDLLVAQESALGSVDVDGQGDTEIDTIYGADGSHQGAQVAWISRQNGDLWGGQFISSFRNLAPVNLPSAPARPCLWGDYHAVRWHPNFQNGLGAFLHTWMDSNFGGQTVVRGTFVFN